MAPDMAKYQKAIFISFSAACILAIITCLIVDFALNRAITWAMYPIITVPFGWLLFTPLLVRKHGVLLSLCSLTVISLPLLFLLEKITPVSGWFAPVAIPSAVIGTGAIWLIFLLFRFVKISPWYKSAITVFILGVLANPAINYHVDMHVYSEFKLLGTILETAACLLISVGLFILGFGRNKAKSMAQPEPAELKTIE